MSIFILARFTDLGIGVTSLTPTVTVINVSTGTTVINSANMTELSSGFYKYDATAVLDVETDYVGYVDGGDDDLDQRYKELSFSDLSSSGYVVSEIASDISALDGKVDTIDGIVDSILASVISTTGSRLLTITVQDGDGVPISDAMVSIYLSGVLISRLRSNVSGVCSTTIEDETYSVVTSKLGYSFTNPTSLIISDDYDMVIVGTGVTLVSLVPGSSCRVYEYLYDLSGVTPLSGDKVIGNATAYVTPFDFNEDRLVEVEAVEGTYDESTGLIYWDIAQGATVSFRIPVVGISKTVLIPDESSARLYDLTLEEEES